MASLQETIATRTTRAMEDLISAASRVPPERHMWIPDGEARTVLDIVQECGRVNARWAEILEKGRFVIWSEEKLKEMKSAVPTLELAIGDLRKHTARYVQVVRATSDDKLDQTLTAPWMTMTVGEWLLHALWHMSYHEGQINYIQTLYGDWGFGA